MDQRPAKAAVDLLPQTADMLVDDVGLRIEMIVPDMFEQHRARHHPPFVAREIGEDAKFARGEVDRLAAARSEEHTSELQSLMRISYAVFCLKKKTNKDNEHHIKIRYIHN